MEFITNSNTISVGIARFVIENDMEKAFRIFLYLKNICSGIISGKKVSFSEIGSHVGIKDKRTIQKHFRKLLKIDWIGYNKVSGNYFIRGFKYLKNLEGVSSKVGIRIELTALKSLKYQLCAGLISFKLKGLRIAQKAFLIKKVGTSAFTKHNALQKVLDHYKLRHYFGLSNTQLAELFGCSKSEANRIKLGCVKNGLLKVNKQFKLIASFDTPDFLLKKNFQYPNRIRVTGNRKRGIKVYEQLTDELIPMFFCVKMNG